MQVIGNLFCRRGETCDGLGPWRDVQISAAGFLFDLASDPGEKTNLAKAYPERVASMSAQLNAILEKATREKQQVPALANMLGGGKVELKLNGCPRRVDLLIQI